MAFQPALGRVSLGRRLFSTPERALALLRAAWPAAVGAELARRTEPVSLEGRRLWVRVPDARWRKVLFRMQGSILKRLRERAGDLAPSRLAFSVSPVVEAAAEPPAPEPASIPAPEPAPVVPPALAAAARAIPDPELRRQFLESSSRYLQRAHNRSDSDA